MKFFIPYLTQADLYRYNMPYDTIDGTHPEFMGNEYHCIISITGNGRF